MSREKRFVGNAGMVETLAYGNGILYGGSFCTGRLSEFDLTVADQIKLVGRSDVLPSPPEAVCINNVSPNPGVRTRYYDSEFLYGPEIANFLEDDVDFVHDITTPATQALIATLPFSLDFNHFGSEMDFYYVSQRSGTTYLSFNSDDGIRVWIGNTLVLEKWVSQTAGTPGDPDRTVTLTLGLGQRVRIKIEYADAKAVTAALQMFYSSDDVTYTLVPKAHLLAVARTGVRVNGPTETGSEVSPDGGGLYAIANGWLYSYPTGLATGVFDHIQITGCIGKTILTTSWFHLLFPLTNSRLQLRDPANITDVLCERKIPFDLDVLMNYKDNLVVGISRDGRYTVMRVTNTIDVLYSGRLADCDTPLSGYIDATNDFMYIACGDHGVRTYSIAIGGRIPYTFALTASQEIRSINDIKSFYEINTFISGSNPDSDAQLSLRLPRFTSTNSRWGIAVATGDAGSVAISEQTIPLPIGIEVPSIPVEIIRYAFRDQGGVTNFVDNAGTSTGVTGVAIDGDTQLIDPFTVPRASAPGDEISFAPNIAFDSPGGLYIEAAVQSNGVGTNECDVLVLGSPEYLRIHVSDNANAWTAFLATVPMTVQNTPPVPYTASAGADYNKDYHQIFVNFKADSVDIWIDGLLFVSDAATPGTIDTSVFDVFANIVSGGDQYLSLSDVRLYIDQEISDLQAQVLSGGSLEIVP